MRWLFFYFYFLFLVCASTVHAKTPQLKIGFVGPLSGPYSHYGKQMWQGAELAIHQLNQSGGIHGMQLQLIALDDRCQTQFAIQQANRFIEESHVQAVVGHVCSAATLATMHLYAEAKILLVTPSATHNKITARGLSKIGRAHV